MSQQAGQTNEDATKRQGWPRYVVVEGIIGAGKTTLAAELAEAWQSTLLEEEFEANPFLRRYYLDPARYAFQTQIFFLLNRYEQLGSLRQLDLFRQRVVADFSFEKDPLFASVTLRPEERRMYEQIRSSLSANMPTPDLIILLHASPQTALRRIAERGREMEEPISREYIESLSAAYYDRFVRNASVPTLIIDTDRFDVRDRSVVDEIIAQASGRWDEKGIVRFTLSGESDELSIPLAMPERPDRRRSAAG